MDAIAAVFGMANYLKTNPQEIGRLTRGLAGMRVGLPLELLRWLARQAEESGKVWDVEVETVPPGMRVAASFSLMKSDLRASGDVFVERLQLYNDQLRLELRLDQVNLTLLRGEGTPVAMLVQSGALDLSKPGNVVNKLPVKPDIIVAAEENRITLDLMKHPKLSEPAVRSAISVLTAFVTIHGIKTDANHLDLSFRALPAGPVAAASTVKDSVENMVGPALKSAMSFIR